MNELLFDKKDVYSWARAEDAKKYIGEEGYFADSLDELQKEIQGNSLETLVKIDLNHAGSFVAQSDFYCFFLPVGKIKPPKMYRPFKNSEEFLKSFPLGSSLEYKKKMTAVSSFALVTSAIDFYEGGQITLGTENLSLYELFADYVWRSNNKDWRLFGVEE